MRERKKMSKEIGRTKRKSNRERENKGERERENTEERK